MYFEPQLWQPASAAVLMVMYDWLVEQMILKAEWKYVSTEHGEQCVMRAGMLWMATSSANSWDFNLQVLHSQFASSCIICHMRGVIIGPSLCQQHISDNASKSTLTLWLKMMLRIWRSSDIVYFHACNVTLMFSCIQSMYIAACA